MLNRFLRTFLIAGITLLIVGSFFFIHPSSRAFIDPFTGELFGEGGFEPDLSGKGGGSDDESGFGVEKDALRGGVIMDKLGNETAK